MDQRIRRTVRSKLHSLVAVGLIVSVVLGSIVASFFVSYKIVDETRSAVSKMNEAIQATQEKGNLGV